MLDSGTLCIQSLFLLYILTFMTDHEIKLLSFLIFSERDNLENMTAVEKLHTLFLQSLYFEMKKNHNDFENKFARLLGIIPVFKHVNKKHAMALNAMTMQKDPSIEEYPALPREIYDVDDKDK